MVLRPPRTTRTDTLFPSPTLVLSVVQVPRLLWWPLLHGVILPRRAPRVAKKYALVGMGEGSPLAVHTRRLAAAIGERLPGVPVANAMRYGGPGIAAAIAEIGRAS